MTELSYIEALFGVVDPEDMEPLIGLLENHKNWGAFKAKIPSHLIVRLVDEVKRLREQVGGYKTLPRME